MDVRQLEDHRGSPGDVKEELHQVVLGLLVKGLGIGQDTGQVRAVTQILRKNRGVSNRF